ncbi:NAD(P)-dependent oxidoreductase [Brachybacterium sp. NPDC056505]|uniref:NAD(P)-dependent oxidoreductase n=1 Tax=Brachybacterium sp. NPDC056505 TaxID=3345843 RepID=UPI00366DAFE3
MSSARPDPTPVHPRIAVFGADGLLGEAVARDALLRSLEVVSAAEDPSRPARISPAQMLVRIDPGDPVGLLDALEGADAVVLALDPDTAAAGRSADAGPGADDVDLVMSVIRGMRRRHVPRLVASSSLALHGDPASPRVDRSLRRVLGELGRELRGAADQTARARDLRRCEMLVAGSGLDWTLLRAGRLTDLLGTRSPRLVRADGAAADPQDPRTRAIPREDLARALVDQALVAGDPRARVRAVAVDS